jgi:hypothetical protein
MAMVALPLSGLAFFGGAPKNDTNEQLARLYGKNSAFTATAEISASGKVTEMEYAFLDGKLRTTIDMAKMKSGAKDAESMEQMQAMGMNVMVTVVRPDKKMTYAIYPGLKAYCELPQTVKASDTQGKPPKIEKTELGKETVEGHSCVKYKVVMTDDDGKQYTMLTWQAADLSDFPIKSEVQSGSDTVTTLFKNIKLGKPDAALFELPSDYKRYGSMQEMMMGSMQQMMRGAQ